MRPVSMAMLPRCAIVMLRCPTSTGVIWQPRLLMLVEPTLGLAPKIKDELAAAISAIAATGVTMVVVDQDIELLLGVCQRLYYLENGRITLETKEGERIDRQLIMEMYFGTAAR